MKKNTKIILILALVVLLLLAWAPWMNDQEVYNKVVQHNPERIRAAEDICGEPLTVHWFPFGRYVANCAIGYSVTFWGEITGGWRMELLGNFFYPPDVKLT